MFEFIGTGSAFNTELGNNGAFIKSGKSLFMIDCGSATFERIQRTSLLEGVEEIYILMTHTHPDHVGSLGDLIFFSYYMMGNVAERNLTVLAPKDLNIAVTLSMMGVEEDTYILSEIDDSSVNVIESFGLYFMPMKTQHVKELNCYGYFFVKDGIKAYYSGDANIIPQTTLLMFHNGTIHYLYQDTCGADYENNVHLSLRELNELIDDNKDLRSRVYCMHLDNSFDEIEAISMGFNVVKAII